MARQREFFVQDSYASAFHRPAAEKAGRSGRGPVKQCPRTADCPDCSCGTCGPACGPDVYQRDFELDSSLFVLQLHLDYFEVAGAGPQSGERANVVDERGSFLKFVEKLLELLETEQEHSDRSAYRVLPKTLGGDDEKTKFSPALGEDIGLIWSYARPSDDPTLGFNIPQNIFVVEVLTRLVEVVRDAPADLLRRAELVRDSVQHAVRKFGLDGGGARLAFEVDGTGNQVFVDDANMPNLLGLPILLRRRTGADTGAPASSDRKEKKLLELPEAASTVGAEQRVSPAEQEKIQIRPLPAPGLFEQLPLNQLLYQNTRNFSLSSANPSFFSGTVNLPPTATFLPKGRKFSGLGSPHRTQGARPAYEECPQNCIWHLGLVQEGWTASTASEKRRVMRDILDSLGGVSSSSSTAKGGGSVGGFKEGLLLHEGFSPDNPDQYNRVGFGWANSLFAQWVLAEWVRLA